MSNEKTPMAFPKSSNEAIGSSGMTLRDYFAGQALAEMLKAAYSDDDTPANIARVASIWAYCAADAMLEARQKGGAA